MGFESYVTQIDSDGNKTMKSNANRGKSDILYSIRPVLFEHLRFKILLTITGLNGTSTAGRLMYRCEHKKLKMEEYSRPHT